MTQQHSAVSTFELGVRVGKVLADITQRRSTQQSVAQGVQHHVAIGMGQQPEPVRNAHPTQGDEIAFREAVHIVAVANTHKKNALIESGRDSTCFAGPLADL
ncbi:hypothetical protein D3C73_1466660 [compost metagenome]